MSVLLSSHFQSGVEPPWSASKVLDISGSLGFYSILEGAMFSSSFHPGDSELDRREKALKERIKSRKKLAFKPGISVGPSKAARRTAASDAEESFKVKNARRSKSPPIVRSSPQLLYNLIDKDETPHSEPTDSPSVWIIDLPLDPGPSHPPRSDSGIGMSPRHASPSCPNDSVHGSSIPTPVKRAPSPLVCPPTPRPAFCPSPVLRTPEWHEEQLRRYPSVDAEPDANTRIIRELSFNHHMAVLEKYHPHRAKILSHFNPMRGNMARAAYHLRLQDLPRKFRKFREPWHPPLRSRSYCEDQTMAIHHPRLRPYVLGESRHCPSCLQDSMCKKLLIWRFHQAQGGPSHRFNMEERRRLQWQASSPDSVPGLLSSSAPYDHEIKLTGLGLELSFGDPDMDSWEEDEVMDICEPDEFHYDPYAVVPFQKRPSRLSDEISRATTPEPELSTSDSESNPDSTPGTPSSGVSISMDIASSEDDWNQRVPDSPRIRDMDSFDLDDDMEMDSLF